MPLSRALKSGSVAVFSQGVLYKGLLQRYIGIWHRNITKKIRMGIYAQTIGKTL